MGRHHHILNAASNLLGIALVLISGLHISQKSPKTFADEIAWGAAVFFGLSCFLSYLAIRADAEETKAEQWADRSFIAGMIVLFASVIDLGCSSL